MVSKEGLLKMGGWDNICIFIRMIQKKLGEMLMEEKEE